jgi:hypothetical protein
LLALAVKTVDYFNMAKLLEAIITTILSSLRWASYYKVFGRIYIHSRCLKLYRKKIYTRGRNVFSQVYKGMIGFLATPEAHLLIYEGEKRMLNELCTISFYVGVRHGIVLSSNCRFSPWGVNTASMEEVSETIMVD